VEAMHAGNSGISCPVVGSALTPAVDPVLSVGSAIEGTGILGFALNAVLIPAQKCSFHRITLWSSHKVRPSCSRTTRTAVCGPGKIRDKARIDAGGAPASRGFAQGETP